MKNLIILISVFFITLTAKAQTLEAKSMKNLIKQIQASEFKYQERGMVFGFNTIQSCMYVGPEIVIIKNYCYPVKQYPARGYTIISPEVGMIDLYEETLPQVVKRDFLITQFPAVLAPYLRHPFPSATLEDLSQMIGKLHYQYNPACWSSNFSFSTEAPMAACNVKLENVVGVDNWFEETQEITANLDLWYSMIKTIESKLK